MRQLSGVIIMLVIISFIAYTANIYLQNTTREIKDMLGQIKNHAENKDWERARVVDHTVHKKWQNMSRIIPILKDQDELHDLEISFTRISALVAQNKKEELLLEIAISHNLLTAISEQEKLSLRNIF